MLSLLTLAAVALAAPPPRRLTLDDAVRLALAQQPVLAQIKDLRDAAAARVDQDRATGRPQLALGIVGQAGNTGGSFTLKAPDIQGAGSGDISLGSRLTVAGPVDSGAALGLGQTLWNPLLGARTGFDEAQQAAQGASYVLRAATVIRDAELAYFEAVRTRRQVAIARGITHNRQLTLAQSEALARAGLVSGLDVQQAHVRLQSAQADTILALGNAEAAFNQLLLQLGYDPSKAPAITLVERGAEGEVDTAEAAPGQNPVLALARARQAIAQANIDVAQAITAPRVAAFLNAGLSPSLGVDALGQPLYGAGLELSAPLYTSGLHEAQVAEARAQARAAAEGVTGVVDAYQQELANARLALTRDRQRFAVVEAQVKLARSSLDLARQRYRFQLASFLDVVNAETAEAGVENALNDARSAVAEDRTVLGFVLGSGLAKYHGALDSPRGPSSSLSPVPIS